MAEAVARIRVAEVLKGDEPAAWILYDARTGKKVDSEAGDLQEPKVTDLGFLGSAILGYAALRAGHVRLHERIQCRGDRGLPEGHGPVDVIAALSKGCHSFFVRVATRVNQAEYRFGARLLGLPHLAAKRPDVLIDRWRMYAEGRGLSVSMEDVARFALRLARADPGDPAKEAIRLGALFAVRRGRIQRASVPGLSVAALSGALPSGEVKLIAWAPYGHPRFVLTVRCDGHRVDAGKIVAQVFGHLMPPQPDAIEKSHSPRVSPSDVRRGGEGQP